MDDFKTVMDKIVADQMIASLKDKGLCYRLLECKWCSFSDLTDRADDIMLARESSKFRSPPELTAAQDTNHQDGIAPTGRGQSSLGRSPETTPTETKAMQDYNCQDRLTPTVRGQSHFGRSPQRRGNMENGRCYSFNEMGHYSFQCQNQRQTLNLIRTCLIVSIKNSCVVPNIYRKGGYLQNWMEPFFESVINEVDVLAYADSGGAVSVINPSLVEVIPFDGTLLVIVRKVTCSLTAAGQKDQVQLFVADTPCSCLI